MSFQTMAGIQNQNPRGRHADLLGAKQITWQPEHTYIFATFTDRHDMKASAGNICSQKPGMTDQSVYSTQINKSSKNDELFTVFVRFNLIYLQYSVMFRPFRFGTRTDETDIFGLLQQDFPGYVTKRFLFTLLLLDGQFLLCLNSFLHCPVFP